MTRTLISTTLWLLAGAAAAAGVFWAFLATPESTVWTLGLSAILLLVLYVVVAITINGALLAWHRRGWSLGVMGSAIGGVAAFLPPLLLAGLTWWLAGAMVGWVERHQGEISAVFIARLGWSDVTRLFTISEWAGDWLRWVVGPFVALVWLRLILTERWRPGRGPHRADSARWGGLWTLMRQGLSPLRLIIATVVFAALAYAPWTWLVPWRPGWIPSDSSELIFIGVKLGLFAVLAAVGGALIIRTAAEVRLKPDATEPPATSSPPPVPA